MDPIIIKQLATQTCSVDNITIMRGQVMRLNGIRAMIWANIREAERSKSSASLINNMLFGLQMVKATCDVIMGVAGEFVPAAAGISTVYSGVQPNAENLGKFAAGQNVGAADLAKGVNAGLHATVKQRLGVDAPLADLADLNKVKADLVINATALDEKALVGSLVDYGVVLGSWITKAAGKAAFAKAIKTTDEIRKAGLAYHSAFKEWDNGDMDSTFEAGIAMSHRQLTKITSRISTLENDLKACGAEMPKLQPSSVRLLTGNFNGPTISARR